MHPLRLCTSACVFLFVLTAALQAQEMRQLYALSRVGETIDAQEARYFNLFPDWPRDDGDQHRQIEVQAVRQSDGTIHFEWIPGGEGLATIHVSGAAAEALGFYLDHFEEIRVHTSPLALLSYPELPQHLRAGAQELLDSGVLPPWWPGWSNQGEGGLVEVRLKSGSRVSGWLLGLTNKRLIICTNNCEFSHQDFSEHLLMPGYGDVDSVVVKRMEGSGQGWIGMYAGLALINMAGNPEPPNNRYEVTEIGMTFPRILGVSLGTLGFLLTSEQHYEYIPAEVGVERLDESQLWESIRIQPGIPPEITAMLDTTNGERLIGGADVPPLIEVFDPEEQQLPRGWWIGSEQLWVYTTELSGYRTGVAGGYDCLLSDRAGFGGLGTGVLLSVGNNSITGGVHGYIRLGVLQFAAGVRGWLQKNQLHESLYSWSSFGRSYSSTSIHTQHNSQTNHYLYSEFGVDIVMRNVSVGVHYLRQFTPSVTVQENWTTRLGSSHPPQSGESFTTDIRIFAWAVSLRIWL